MEVEGVPAWLVANFIQTAIAKPDFDAFGGRPMLVFRSTPEVSWAFRIKGLVDRTGALVGLIVFAIPMLIIAIGIRLTQRAGHFQIGTSGEKREAFCDVQISLDVERRGDAAGGTAAV